ncbi:MAG: hypothetical protein J7K83_01220 [Candidatus Aenigmarchaeota archaeon]|nr:hypothetical protein [Candidatus Aenigmarchaeota archaeon]
MLELAVSLFLISLALYFFIKTLKNVLMVILLSIVLMLVINYLGIRFNIQFLQPITTILSYFFDIKLYDAKVHLISEMNNYSLIEVNNTGSLPIKIEKIYVNGHLVNFTSDRKVISPKQVASVEINETSIDKLKIVFDKLTIEKEL